MPRARGATFDLDQNADYNYIIHRFPWVVEKGHNCVLSPDSDGLLCGLLMSHYLNWKIRGFYDGKVAVIERGYTARDCVFLDMEIFRKGIRSIGHHMLLLNKRHRPANWDFFTDCISLNNLRDYDTTQDFTTKYPFATVHALIPILHEVTPVHLSQPAVVPLLFTDGTWENLFRYMENCMDWIRYLGATPTNSPLHALFLNDRYTLHLLMDDMNQFLRRRDQLTVHRERGDRIAISQRGGDGSPTNLDRTGRNWQLRQDAKSRAEAFIEILAELTGWAYKPFDWTWVNWELYQFTKDNFDTSGKALTIKNYADLLRTNPLSWAITSRNNLEYTLEQPSKLP